MMMKKITSLLMAVLMVCTMMTFAATPAFAEETPETVNLSSAAELQSFLNKLESGANVSVHMTEEVTITSTIKITKPCTVNFEGENKFKLTTDCRGFYIESDNVILNFGEKSVINGYKTKLENDDGDDQGHAFYIKGNDFSISGVEFKDCSTIPLGQLTGKGSEGGAIYIKGANASIENCTFNSCTAKNSGGAVYFCGGKNNTVSSCSFNQCISNYQGGAVCFASSSSDAKVSDCTFTECKSIGSTDSYGGALAIYGSESTVESCKFTKTEALHRGGAIYVANEKCRILECTFDECKATHDGGDGGAIYIWKDKNECEIKDCIFSKCSAEDCGGAIEYYSIADGNKVINCVFMDCTAEDDSGGAIDLGYDSDGFYVYGCRFERCNAEEDGGAINICQQCDDCKIEYCTFTDCHALDGDGGAIFFGFGDARCKVEYCDFSNCSADGDGDYVLGDGDTLIKNCTPKTEDEDLFYDCEFEFSATGSVLSEGNLWIIIAVAVIAIGGIAALLIVKKKKKPALAVGADNTDEE